MAETSIMRIKITMLMDGGQDKHKMVAANAKTSWGEFKKAAATKLGLAANVELKFFWEGCEVEEPDSRALSLFTKDGDTLVLVPEWKQDIPKEESSSPVHAGPAVVAESAPADAIMETHAVAAAASRRNSGASAERAPSRRSSRQSPEDEDYQPVASSHQTNNKQGRMRQRSERRSTQEGEGIQYEQLPVEIGTVDSGVDKRCTCRRSKCLKLYCVCWASGVLCNNCSCKDCLNIPENAELIRAEQEKAIMRNPLAFSTKVEQAGDGELTHKIGCRCRNSRCLKKYCECYDGGVSCTTQCRCSNCKNMGPDPDQVVHRHSGGSGLDSLASLASAAQLADGCLDEELLGVKAGSSEASPAADEDAAPSTGKKGRRASLPPMSRPAGKLLPERAMSAKVTATAAALWPSKEGEAGGLPPRPVSEGFLDTEEAAAGKRLLSASASTRSEIGHNDLDLVDAELGGVGTACKAEAQLNSEEAPVPQRMQPGSVVAILPSGSKGPSNRPPAEGRPAMISAFLPPRSNCLNNTPRVVVHEHQNLSSTVTAPSDTSCHAPAAAGVDPVHVKPAATGKVPPASAQVAASLILQQQKLDALLLQQQQHQAALMAALSSSSAPHGAYVGVRATTLTALEEKV